MLALEFLAFGDFFPSAALRAHAALNVLAGLADQPTCSSNSSSASCGSVAGRCDVTDAQSGLQEAHAGLGVPLLL